MRQASRLYESDAVLEMMEKLLEIAPRDEARFRELVVLPLLEGAANWTESDRPRRYLARAIRNQKIDEEKELSLRRKREAPETAC